MWRDPLVEELRKRRRELMAEFDYNPQKVLEGLKRQRYKYSDRLIHVPKKHHSTVKS